MVNLPFKDRLDAGRMLAAELSRMGVGRDAVLLGMTRGGVPVAFAVADCLHVPLDIMVARKLGVPWQPELAMGAIAGTTQVLDESTIAELGISRAQVREVMARERAEMQRREALYRAGSPAPDLNGRTVVLIDDGLATGNTMVAAALDVRDRKAANLIVAVPVGSAEACDRLSRYADEVVCLAIPPSFGAVGEWYGNFRQVTDTEVQNLLAEARHRLRTYLASPTAA
jgi:putative phosphoribosyl transferase